VPALDIDKITMLILILEDLCPATLEELLENSGNLAVPELPALSDA
jgi:hypothetical protein